MKLKVKRSLSPITPPVRPPRSIRKNNSMSMAENTEGSQKLSGRLNNKSFLINPVKFLRTSKEIWNRFSGRLFKKMFLIYFVCFICLTFLYSFEIVFINLLLSFFITGLLTKLLLFATELLKKIGINIPLQFELDSVIVDEDQVMLFLFT
ncbi:hypothetical protein HZS_5856 [Henneguya salminicola]|nr:hypothetical protein HZS_5856 [Henneguya salminicola]